LDSYNDFFSADSVELHNTAEQLLRQNGLSNLDVKSASTIDSSGIILDHDTHTKYDTTLSSCSCDDFSVRQLPCSHMYKLASKLNKYASKRELRPTKLMADFSKGYADGWKFVIRPCNFLDIDVQYTVRASKGIKKSILTQGKLYNFTSGSVFYNDPIAYNVSWGIALQSLLCSIQVTSTVPSYLEYYVEYDSIHKLLTRKSRINYGTVNFNVYHPNSSKTAEELVASYICQQDNFLKLLKTGVVIDTDHISHHII